MVLRMQPPPPLLLLLLLLSGRGAQGDEAGGSLVFNGGSDYATVFPGFRLLSEWTIEAWVRPDDAALDEGRCVLGLHTAGLRNLLTVTVTDRQAWQVLYGAAEHPIPFRDWTGSPNGLYTSSVHHISITHEAVTGLQYKLRLYLNSTLRAQWFVDAGASGALTQEPALPMLLGACHKGVGSEPGAVRERFFGGHVDEVRWWGKALDDAQIATSWRWSGPPLQWPREDFNGRSGDAAVLERAAALRAQYSMDRLDGRLLVDGGFGGRHGVRGTGGDPRDAGRYAKSPFSDSVELGSLFFDLRTSSVRTVDFAPFVYSVGSPSFNGLLILRDVSHNSSTTLRTTQAAPVTEGSLVPGVRLQVATSADSPHDSFAVQPCVGPQGLLPQLSSCSDQQIYDVSLFVTESTPPIAGPSHAVQLLAEGGFLRTPRLPATATLELWLRLTPPIRKGATLLSVQERTSLDGTPGREALRMWLDPSREQAVLDVCSAAAAAGNGSGPAAAAAGFARLLVPSVASEGAQHLAVAFELQAAAAGRSYAVTVHRNGVRVLSGAVQEPCFALDAPELQRPTLGQRFATHPRGELRRGAAPASGLFAAMYVAELRVWGRALATAEVAAAMLERLAGNETGLLGYAQVVREDAVAAEAAPQSLPLLAPAELAAEPFEVVCAASSAWCPSFAEGTGFAVRPSPFGLPAETLGAAAAGVWTTASGEAEVPIVGHDRDNYKDHVLGPSDVDALTFEIFGFPDQLCGRIRLEGSDNFISTVNRWPPTELVAPEALPLHFTPMGGACKTQLKYRVIDSQQLRSAHSVTIPIEVLQPGVTLDGVSASNPSVASLEQIEIVAGNLGGVIRLTFSGPTNRPDLEVHELLEVLDGSLGEPPPTAEWSPDGAALLLSLGSNGSSSAASGGALVVPGLTRFRLRPEAGLRPLSDPHAAPCDAISPPLQGTFTEPTCPPGAVLNTSNASCDACSAGRYWSPDVAGGPLCVQCPVGRANPSPAAFECEPCAPGRYMPEERQNRSECLLSPKGHYVPEAGAAISYSCMAGTLAPQLGMQGCSPCPSGADCSMPGFVGERAIADPGYFEAEDGVFLRCRLPSDCLGAGTCAIGTMDANLGCYRCAPGYARGDGTFHDRGACSTCPSMEWTFGVFGLALISTVLFAFCLARLNITSARRPACLHAFILKIGISHLFLMHSFESVMEWELEPGFGEAALVLRYIFSGAFVWDGMMPSGLVRLECVLEQLEGVGREGRLWLALLFWLFLPGLLALCCLVLSLLTLLAGHLGQGFCGCCARGEDVADASGPAEGQLNAVVPVWIPPEDSSGGADAVTNSGADTRNTPWQSVWSYEHRRFYYHNATEGISTWSRPPGVPEPSPPQRRKQPGRAAELAPETLEYRLLGIWRRLPSARPFGEHRAAFLEDSAGILIAIFILTCPSSVRHLLVFVRCDHVAGAHENRLLVDPTLVCGQGVQQSLATVAWLGVVILCWGLPLATFGLCSWRRHELEHFHQRVSLGIISAEYESDYYYWEAAVLFRRFAVLLAVGLTHAVPLQVRLVLLLACGNVSLWMHHSCEPFANRSGILLDTLEANSLRIFCALTAALLLGTSQVVHPYVATAAVGAALILHIDYVVRLAIHALRFARRAVAEQVIEGYLIGRSSDFLAKLCFQGEANSRRYQACVVYNTHSEAIELKPGLEGKIVTDQEQLYLAHGLADSFSAIICTCKVDRLSVDFIEFLSRQVFASSVQRLKCEQRLSRSLSRKSLPSVEEFSSEMGGKPSRQQNPVHNTLFDPQSFAEGMLPDDFQQSILAVCSSRSDEELEEDFRMFMLHKFGPGKVAYHLSPLERMLKSIRQEGGFDPRMVPPTLAALPASPTGRPSLMLQLEDADPAADQQGCLASALPGSMPGTGVIHGIDPASAGAAATAAAAEAPQARAEASPAAAASAAAPAETRPEPQRQGPQPDPGHFGSARQPAAAVAAATAAAQADAPQQAAELDLSSARRPAAAAAAAATAAAYAKRQQQQQATAAPVEHLPRASQVAFARAATLKLPVMMNSAAGVGVTVGPTLPPAPPKPAVAEPHGSPPEEENPMSARGSVGSDAAEEAEPEPVNAARASPGWPAEAEHGDVVDEPSIPGAV